MIIYQLITDADKDDIIAPYDEESPMGKVTEIGATVEIYYVTASEATASAPGTITFEEVESIFDEGVSSGSVMILNCQRKDNSWEMVRRG